MKNVAGFMIVSALFLLFVGCQSETGESGGEGRLQVIATVFPQFDFVRQIAGDRVELSMLISPGAEAHGFEPSPRDIVAMYSADLIIYIGGHDDVWLGPILHSIGRDDMRTVALTDLVELVLQEIVEGMEIYHPHDHHHDHEHHDHDHHDHDHDDHEHHDHDHEHHDDNHDHDHEHGHHDDNHDHDHGHHHHHDHDHVHYDEHVWTCPRNAITIVEALTEVLSELDPANESFFRENAAAFINELRELDAEFTQVVAEGARRTIVFGDRFPFRYLTDTYGITYFAAFTGCSAETQASPGTIAFLIEKVREENIPVIFHIEFSNLLIANTIVRETGTRLVEMHSAHNVSHEDFNAGVTYIDIMRRNIESLREGLN